MVCVDAHMQYLAPREAITIGSHQIAGRSIAYSALPSLRRCARGPVSHTRSSSRPRRPSRKRGTSSVLHVSSRRLPVSPAGCRCRCRRSLLALAVFRNVASGNSQRSLGEQGLFEAFWRLHSRCVSATETWPMFTNVASTLHVFFNTASARVAWIDRNPYGFDRRAGRSSSEDCVRASTAWQRRAFPTAG